MAYGVVTAWRRDAPTAFPLVYVIRDADELLISWIPQANSDGYEVFRGSLPDLRSSAGDFASSTTGCLAEDLVATEYSEALTPASEFFLVRAVNCGGNGTVDSGGTAQVGSRDNGVSASGTCD